MYVTLQTGNGISRSTNDSRIIGFRSHTHWYAGVQNVRVREVRDPRLCVLLVGHDGSEATLLERIVSREDVPGRVLEA